MKSFLWPAKRQRKERMRAAVQQSTGMRAEKRMVVIVVLVLSKMGENATVGLPYEIEGKTKARPLNLQYTAVEAL